MAIKGDIRVARRYASALFDAAGNVGPDGIGAVAADLSVIEELFDRMPDLQTVLSHPLVSDERKHKVIADAFQSRLGATALNFLYLMVRKRREDIIRTAIAEYRLLADAHAGRVEAFVDSAFALDDDQLSELRAALEERTGKTVLLHAAVDPTMLGGLRVRIGDVVIDSGLRAGLEQLRLQLMAAR